MPSYWKTIVLDLINRQKAEIERLTKLAELRLQDNKDTCKLLVEKEKQVDELMRKVESYQHSFEYNQGYEDGKSQAVKDTAKEILQGFMKWLNQAINESYDKSVKGSIHYGGKNRAFHEVKELVKKVAEEKGVEVE